MAPKAYTEETVRNAVFDVIKNGISINKAYQKYSIPTSTLSDRVNGRHASKDDPASKPSNTLLSEAHKDQLVAWIL